MSTADLQVADSEADDLIEVEVCCAGVSYFTREPVLGAHGEQMKNPATGEDIFVTLRKEAVLRDRIKLTSYETKRLRDLGAVQEPGSAPLPGDPNRPVQPTPFGIPVPDQDAEPDEHGNLPLTAYKGPVMGDPNPVGSVNPNDANALASPTLTAEEAARMEADTRAAAAKAADAATDDGAALRSGYEEEDKEDLKAEAESEGLNVVRKDGRTDLSPTKKDYVDALVEHRLSEDEEDEE